MLTRIAVARSLAAALIHHSSDTCSALQFMPLFKILEWRDGGDRMGEMRWRSLLQLLAT